MKKREIVIGRTYHAKISGKIVPVEITADNPLGGWMGRNTKTGRDVRIRSAQKLRFEALRVSVRHLPTESFVLVNDVRVGQGNKEMCQSIYEELRASRAKATDLLNVFRK